MSTNSANVKLQCVCGVGYCKVLKSSTSKNPGRMFITCPNRVGNNKGFGLWQWLDEVRMCQCDAGICKLLKSHSDANPEKWFYCCPKSPIGVKGCGYFEWKDADVEDIKDNKVIKEKKEFENDNKLAELRSYLEVKQAITNEVCESILEKMKKLTFG